VRLADQWEKKGVLIPREVRSLTDLIEENGLAHFRATKEGVHTVVKRMLRLVKNTTAPPVRAHVAVEWPGEGSQYYGETDPSQGQAYFGKGAKPGKGGDGCFQCGSADHWSRECPKGKGKPKGAGKGGKKGHWAEEAQGDNEERDVGYASKEVDEQRTSDGACWECGSKAHQKKLCPKWLARQNQQDERGAAAKSQPKHPKKPTKGKYKARFIQAVAAALEGLELSSDEEGNPGNKGSPPPRP